METREQPDARHVVWSEIPCGQCGAKLKYQPGTESLRCEFCGFTQAVGSGAAAREVVAHDLDEALAATGRPSAATLARDVRQVTCETCSAVTVLSGVADRCPFCGSPRVLAVAAEGAGASNAFGPDALLAFKVPKEKADTLFREWVAGLWLAPRDLRTRAATHGIDGVYLPYWAFDARTVTDYAGERGEHYEEVEKHRDEKGQEKTRKVRKTRWVPVEGSVDVPFADVLICASRSLPQKLVDSLGRWDLGELRPFSPEYVSGFKAEQYAVDLKDAFERAKQTMDAPIASAVKAKIGGDEQRVTSREVRYEGVTFKLLMLPLWLASFRYGDRVYRVLVNAATGKVKGERPWSPAKVGATGVIALVLAAVLVWGLASWVDCSCAGEAPRQGPRYRRRAPGSQPRKRPRTKTKRPRRQGLEKTSWLEPGRDRGAPRAPAPPCPLPGRLVRRDRLPG